MTSQLTIVILCVFVVSLANGNVFQVRRSQENPSKIVGGHEAEPHSHPYIVSLQKQILWMYRHNCGGSILTEYWVMTAGHCISQSVWSFLTPLHVFAGIHSVKGRDSSTQKRRVVEKIVHPDYEGDVNPNDIAVLRIDKPFIFNKYVLPIAMPMVDSTPMGNSTLSGWGLLKTSPTSQIPEYLQEIDLPILTFKECNDSIESFRDSPDDRNPLDERSNVCTGPLTGGKSACNGDSGGPLTQTINGNEVQIGVVSWGISPCGSKGAPTVYTKVSSFIDFILEHVDLNDLSGGNNDNDVEENENKH